VARAKAGGPGASVETHVSVGDQGVAIDEMNHRAAAGVRAGL